MANDSGKPRWVAFFEALGEAMELLDVITNKGQVADNSDFDRLIRLLQDYLDRQIAYREKEQAAIDRGFIEIHRYADKYSVLDAIKAQSNALVPIGKNIANCRAAIPAIKTLQTQAKREPHRHDELLHKANAIYQSAVGY